MSPIDGRKHEVVQAYFDAWNRQDAAGLQALLGSGGTYRDPLVPDGLNGAGLAGYASSLWQAFPDLRFESGEILGGASGRLACEWVYDGHFDGALNGIAPNQQHIRFAGIDVFVVNGDHLALVWGHYDAKRFFELLGASPS